LRNGRFAVKGKGNKLRPAFFQEEASEALLLYRKKVKHRSLSPKAAKAKAVTCSGLLQLVQRIGAKAGSK
jgi:site-specific recombinase XerD